MQFLFSTHNDDSEIYCAYAQLRNSSLTVICCTDSFIQPLRGDKGCSAEERRAESEAAAKVLGTSVVFLGIPDNQITDEVFRQALEKKFSLDDHVYLPALQGGNFAHDIVSRVGSEFFKNVTYYATYTKGQHFTPIGEAVIPTYKEMDLKDRALDCYQSQIRLSGTKPHFDAVRRKPEYLLEREKPAWDVLLNTPVRFGLVQQGHVPTIERMLAESRTWKEIAAEVGWYEPTLVEHYGWYQEQKAIKGERA